MKKIYTLSYNSKNSPLNLIKSKEFKLVKKTDNSLLLELTEEQANLLSRNGYNPHSTQKLGVRFRSASQYIDLTKLTEDQDKQGREEHSEFYYYLLKFIGPVQADWLEHLEEKKILIEQALTDFSYIVSARSTQVEKVKPYKAIQFIVPYAPILKVHPSLFGKRSRQLKLKDLKFSNIDAKFLPYQQLEISSFNSSKTKKIENKIKDLGLHIVDINDNTIRVVAGTENIEDLATIEGVDTIYPYYPTGLDNDVSAGLTGVTTVRDTEELDGRGQVVGVVDTGLDNGVNDATMHLDFRGRITSLTGINANVSLSDVDGHGTHVAGTVCGDGAESNGEQWSGAGMAPAAQLAFIATDGSIQSAAIMQSTFTTMRTNSAMVVNNSWGKNSNSAYDNWSSSIDEYIWDNRDFLPVFTAGNSGRDSDGDGVTDLDALRSTGAAKNCITVGASENNRPVGSLPNGGAISAVYGDFGELNIADPLATDNISDNPEGMHHRSSRGPTDDGRIKPDIVAIGTNVLSTKSSVYDSDEGELNALWPTMNNPLTDLYAFSQGTSMAAPQITGIAILIRQYLAERRGHNNPSAALLKAIIINGAYELSGQYNNAMINPHNDAGVVPNSIQGWGRANVMDSLFPSGTGRIQYSDRLEYALATGETKIFEVHVSSVDHPLLVTMAYTDTPGAGIINQLYLQVEQPDGSFLDGDYNIDGSINAYTDIAVNGVINNVQKVNINPPVIGNYRIHIHAFNVSQGIQPSPRSDLAPNVPVQDFALVVANATGFSANPSSVIQVFDRSGSMGILGYADPAKQRAKEFADFLQINDKHAVVSFNHDAFTEYPSSTITSYADIEAAKVAIDGINIVGNTSMGAGVELAQSLFAADALPHAMVLFSDGFSNTAPYAINPNDNSLPIVDADFIATGTVIYTIALGASADTVRLADLATATGGSFYTIDSMVNLHVLNEIYYNIRSLTSGSVLLDYGTDILPAADSDSDHLPDKNETPFSASIKSNRLNPSTVPKAVFPKLPKLELPNPIYSTYKKEISFVVDISEEIRVCVSTNQSNPDFAVVVIDPNGKVYNEYSNESQYIVGADYKHLVIKSPLPGSWKLRVYYLGSGDFKFSYAVYSQTLYDLEVQTDEIVEVGTDPTFDIVSSFGGSIVDKQNISTVSYAKLRSDKLIKENKKELKKIKLSQADLDDHNDDLVRLELLSQKVLKESGLPLIRQKSYVKNISLNDKASKKISIPQIKDAETLRHQVVVKGVYSHKGEIYPYMRKKLVCQHVRDEVKTSGKLKIEEIWTSYHPSKYTIALKHQSIRKSGETVVGVRVVKNNGTPLNQAEISTFNAVVSRNDKELSGLVWVYEKTSRSFITHLPKLKGKLHITAKLKQKGKKVSKQLEWVQ